MTGRRRAVRALTSLGLLALAGCDRGFFQSAGYVASDGGALGVWRSAPQACSREPFDGQPPASTTSLAMFVWEDPSVHDPYRDQHRKGAPDAPMRLEISRAGTGYIAGLATVKTSGIRITSADCSVFQVDIADQPAAVKGNAPSLAGRVQMDCNARGSHVTADFQFRHCEF